MDHGTLGTQLNAAAMAASAIPVGQYLPFGFSTSRHLLPMPEWAALTAENNALMPARPVVFSTCTSDCCRERNELMAMSTGVGRARRCADIPASRRGGARSTPLKVRRCRQVNPSASAPLTDATLPPNAAGLAGVAAFRCFHRHISATCILQAGTV